MGKDHFMVCANLEAYLYGQNYTDVMTCDMHRYYSSWGSELDAATIDAPILTFNGELDKASPAALAPFFLKIYPQAKTTVLPGHGHVTMFLELRDIMQKLVQLS